MGTNLLAFVIVLGVLIFFHELGHFLVARLCGVGVEKFSLGFGPRIFGKTVGRTDYRLSAIPLGGYVKMVGDEPDGELPPEDVPLSFTHKSVWRRILIVAAGPLFNILLALLIYAGFFWASGIQDIRPVIRAVETGSPAAGAGLLTDDRILTIGGEKVTAWRDINAAISQSDGRRLDIAVLRDGRTMTFAVTPKLIQSKDLFGDDISYYGIGVSGFSELRAVVGDVVSGMPAQKAGLKKGDEIIAIDGRAIANWKAMQSAISDATGASMTFDIRRGDQVLSMNITPTLISEKNLLGQKVTYRRIGITTPGVTVAPEDEITISLNAFQAAYEGAMQTWKVVGFTGHVFLKLIKGAVPANSLGGPILIAQMAGKEARQGVVNLLFFIAAVSIHLAILNFLPIPVLDGGHLLFFTIEAIIGRPVNTRVREIAQQAGIFILILLMVFVFYNDITRTFFS